MDIRGTGGLALRILNLGTKWGWVISFTPSRFTAGKRPLIHWIGRWVVLQSRSGGGGEEKTGYNSCEDKIPTSLSGFEFLPPVCNKLLSFHISATFYCFFLSSSFLSKQGFRTQKHCMPMSKYFPVPCWFCLVTKWLIFIAAVMTSFAVDQQT